MNKKLALFGFLLFCSQALATNIPQASNDTGRASFQAIFPGTAQKVTTSAVSAQSAVLGASTIIVRLFCSADCYLAFGASPTATTTTSMFLPAGIIEYYGVTPATKIAVIQSTAAGTLFITEGK